VARFLRRDRDSKILATEAQEYPEAVQEQSFHSLYGLFSMPAKNERHIRRWATMHNDAESVSVFLLESWARGERDKERNLFSWSMYFFYNSDFDICFAKFHIKVIEHSFADEWEIFFEFFLGEFQKWNHDFTHHRVFILGIRRRGKLFAMHILAHMLHQNLQNLNRRSL